MGTERDQRFEIQYLISLIIAVLGSLSSETIAKYAPNKSAYLFLFIVFTHIVVFNIVYTLRRATDFEIEKITQLDQATRWTLYSITAVFAYFLLGILFSWILVDLLPYQPDDVFIDTVPMILFPINLTYRILFAYTVPGIIILVMVLLGWRSIMPSLRQAQAVEITVVPDELSVLHDFDSTRPLHINIANNSDEEIIISTAIDFPDEVEWRYRGTETGRGTLSEESAIPSSGHEPYDIELRYQDQERMTREVTVDISMDGDTFSENLDIILEEY
jgi:hypothetical protein